MKKTAALVLIVASLFAISCNDGSKTETEVITLDSTEVIVDTTMVVDSIDLTK